MGGKCDGCPSTAFVESRWGWATQRSNFIADFVGWGAPLTFQSSSLQRWAFYEKLHDIINYTRDCLTLRSIARTPLTNLKQQIQEKRREEYFFWVNNLAPDDHTWYTGTNRIEFNLKVGWWAYRRTIPNISSWTLASRCVKGARVIETVPGGSIASQFDKKERTRNRERDGRERQNTQEVSNS